jgi:Mor family transcriptional regulator
MSDLMLRDLAEECAAKMADTITKVVVEHIRSNLAGTVQAVLREKYAGEDLKIYVSKHSLSHRRMRNEAIRTRYNGRNIRELMT